MVRHYIFLASSCAAVGIVITFIVLAVCQYFGINIDKNLWVLAIPAVLSVTLNILVLELYHKYRQRKG